MRLRQLGVILIGLGFAASEAGAITAVGKSGVIAPAKPPEKPPPKKVAKKTHAKVAPAAAAAPAAGPAVGDLCKLKKPLKVTTSRGKAQTLRGGVTYKVDSFEKDVAVLTAGDGAWRVKQKVLAPVCAIVDNGPPLLKADSPPLLQESSPPLATPPVAAAPVTAAPATPSESPPVAAAAPPPVDTPPPIEHAAEPHADSASSHSGMRAAAWTLSIVGVLGLGAGGTFFALGYVQANGLITRANAYNTAAVPQQSEFTSINQGRDQVRLYDTLMYVAGGVGVAALATGIGLFVASSEPSAKTDVRVQLVPNLGGMSLVGNF